MSIKTEQLKIAELKRRLCQAAKQSQETMAPMLYYLRQKIKAQGRAGQGFGAREPFVDYIFRTFFQEADTKFWPSREVCMEILGQAEKENPAAFEQWFVQAFAHFNPEYFDALMRTAEAAQHGVKCTITPGLKDGAAMMGYTIPGTMFSNVTINQTALFRSHADRNNLAGALGCLAAFGKGPCLKCGATKPVPPPKPFRPDPDARHRWPLYAERTADSVCLNPGCGLTFTEAKYDRDPCWGDQAEGATV